MVSGGLLALGRDRKVSQPEDKVFAILGLVGPDVQSKLLTSPTEARVAKVYIDYTRVLVNQTSWPHVLSLVGKIHDGQKSLPSWVPDFSVSLRPKPFWYYGRSSFAAATSVPPAFELLESEDYSAQTLWDLQISAASFEIIEQVGEIADLFRSYQAMQLRGHMLDVVNNTGKYYHPTGELTMAALLHTITAGVFLSHPKDPDELKYEIMDWLGSMFFPTVYFNSSRLFNLVVRPPMNLILKSLPDKVEEDSPQLNDKNLDTPAVVETFVELHHSEESPFAVWYQKPIINEYPSGAPLYKISRQSKDTEKRSHPNGIPGTEDAPPSSLFPTDLVTNLYVRKGD